MNALIHENVLRIARSSADSIAVNEKTRSISYQQLAEKSLFISRHINEVRKKSESTVALFTGKNIEAVVSIYSVLRAGLSYLPLDTKSPAPRIKHIISDCQVKTFITIPSLLSDLVDLLSDYQNDYKIIVVSEKNDQAIRASEDVSYLVLNDISAAETDDIFLCEFPSSETAAVLYTSGSTGMPKGVVITHTAITTFVLWANYYFGLNSADRCASHAPLHFDLSIFDIFAVHYSASATYLIPESMVGNPKYLSAFIEKNSITVWQSVPSALTLMCKYGSLEKFDLKCLRHVLFAGEKMSVKILKSLAGNFTQAMFHNVYGSTEMNDTFVYSLPSSTDLYPDPLPIGKPLPYVNYKIVDIDGFHGPDITHGELFVCAPSVMPGYKNSTENETCFRFFPADDRRYYKTKDIVKMLPDGNLIFCARTDDIVKTNGNRVNIVEIESILQDHKDTREVAVLALEDEEAGSRLIAYIYTESTDISALNLKLHCAEHLPKYAIPHFFEIGDSPFPKTPSGKINKNHLTEMRGKNVKTA